MTALPTTLCALFGQNVRAGGEGLALSMAGHPGLTWRQYDDAVRALAPGFVTLGMTRGETVAILTGPRPEFHVVDTALLHAGAVPYSVHEGDTAAGLAENLRTARTRHMVTEHRLLPLARDVAAARGGPLELICVDDGELGTGERSLSEVAALAGPALDELRAAASPEDIATLIFTSGTTGRPKAVQLSHSAIVAAERGTHALAPFGDRLGTVLSYLPLNHIAERFMSHYAHLTFGVSVRSVPDPDRLYDEIAAVRPRRFFGIPRVYEKLLDRARTLIRADERLVAALADSLAAQRAGRVDAAALAALGSVREQLGLAAAEYLGVATAPSAYAMLEELAAIGLRVSDIWGMSEVIMCTLNPPDSIRLGTVGRFLPGMEGRIAADGEVLVRGPHEFSGYLGDPVRTAEMKDADGWLHTGDIGSIDDDGYLSIRGRKKEILITATGKNIAPSTIEGAVKNASALIDHACAIADNRRFVTLLVALDADELARLAGPGDFTALAGSTEVRAEVAAAVDRANETLSRPERVRAFHVVATEWRPGGDELTVTAKLRRDRIVVKYADQIEELYSGA